MICVETFGCSGKLPFSETRAFAKATGLEHIGNFSALDSTNLIISIDRVSRCAVDWRAFAKIALTHVARDVEVGLAQPVHACFCFEFGDDANEAERLDFVRAVSEEAALRGIVLGKCHSAITEADVTSVVVAIVGERKDNFSEISSQGTVWLNSPLGRAKLLYLMSLNGEQIDEAVIEQMAGPVDLRSLRAFGAVSDVSGHGMAGCLADLADRLNLAIEVWLSRKNAIDYEVIDRPVELLMNAAIDFPSVTIADDALPLALLKETAGPLIGITSCVDSERCEELTAQGWVKIGEFSTGTPRVDIRWTE